MSPHPSQDHGGRLPRAGSSAARPGLGTGSEDVCFGLVGYGLFGQHHAAAIQRAAGARLVAIAVPSPASQAAAREAHPQCDVVADYRQLVTRKDIDVVDVVVPNHLHFEVSDAALQAGKHLFVEKPMALKLDHCHRLLETAAAKKRLIAVNHEMRLSALWGRAKQLIDEGAIGRTQFALFELSRFPYRQGSDGWRYDIDRVGNWILEEPVHFFDMARWYLSACGDPLSVYARANGRDAEQAALKDNFTAVINFPQGAYAVVSQTLAAFEHHVTVKVTGTEGTLWAAWSAPDARSDKTTFQLRYGLGDAIHDVPLDEPTGELVELGDHVAAVARSVRDGAPPPCSGNDGRWSALMCLAAAESVQSQQVVTLNGYGG